MPTDTEGQEVGLSPPDRHRGFSEGACTLAGRTNLPFASSRRGPRSGPSRQKHRAIAQRDETDSHTPTVVGLTDGFEQNAR